MSKLNPMTLAIAILSLGGAAFLGYSLKPTPSASPPAAQAPAQDIPFESAQETNNTGLEWHSYDEGIALAKATGKPVFVQYYATWCGYCKKMDREVFSNDKIRDQIHAQFVPIRVTESSSNQVDYQGKKVTEKELTAMAGVQGFPTMEFLSAEGQAIGKIPGYIGPDEVTSLLAYIHSGSYKNQDFNSWRSQQKG
jgi:thioredoxin-related protein